MVRITQNLLSDNFLLNVRLINQRLARLLDQTSTGLKFRKPSDDPAGVATSMVLSREIAFLDQFERNINDGKNQLSFLESNLSNLNNLVQRARELAVQGASDTLSDADRRALSLEIDQILEQVAVLSNDQFAGRYAYGGFRTLTEPFTINRDTADGKISSLFYRGDMGEIMRRVSQGSLLDVNLTGKEVFLGTTYTLTGREVATDKELGYLGTVEINGVAINVDPSDRLSDIRDKINRAGAGVFASITETGRLVLESLDSSREIELRDLTGTVLDDLELIPRGAFNIAVTPPALPLVDSTGAIKTGSPVTVPLTIDATNDRLVIQLSGPANDGISEAKSLILTHGTYATVADLVAEIQARADAAFGEGKLVVRENAGAIELETGATGSAVLPIHLVVGGQDDLGAADTASVDLGLTVAGGPEQADVGGTDGNDKFTIDLGPSATLEGNDPLPQIIDIDASLVGSTDDLVANINDKIRQIPELVGQVRAVNFNGRLMIETIKTGEEVKADDLVLADETPGTLAALGILTTQTPPQVVGTLTFPPGTTVTATNNEFSIDIGARISKDGTNPPPQTIAITPGTYTTIASIVAEINARIAENPILFGQVEAVAGPSNEIIIRATRQGSRYQEDQLTLADVEPGTLANLGLDQPTDPGGGTSPGIGRVKQPDNLIKTLIDLRDDLRNSAGPDTRLVDAAGPDGTPLNIFPEDVLTLEAAGNTRTIVLSSFFTLKDLARELEDLIGLGVKVEVTADGAIRIRNPQGATVPNIRVSLTNRFGQPNQAFNQMFDGTINGDLLPGQTRTSEMFTDPERFKEIGTTRLRQLSRRLEEVVNFRSIVGSRDNRAEAALTQLDTFRLRLREVKLNNDSVDMAETITELKEVENILRATLAVGARIIQPSLLDFLR